MKVPRLMEWVLVPLALLGLCGGVLNLPEYLGGGWLDRFLAPLSGQVKAEVPSSSELILQALAGVLAIAGLSIAHFRYGGKRRQRVETAPGQESQVAVFFRDGWRFDALYRFLFVRPYEVLSRFFWERVDEGVIDDSLDRLGNILGRGGQGLGAWTTGRVSGYLLSFAAGAALILVYLAWVVY